MNYPPIQRKYAGGMTTGTDVSPHASKYAKQPHQIVWSPKNPTEIHGFDPQKPLKRLSKSLQIIDLNWLKLNHLEPSWNLKHVKGYPPAQRKFSCWSTLISCAFNCWSTLKMANRRQDIARHHKGSKDESKVTQDVPHTHIESRSEHQKHPK